MAGKFYAVKKGKVPGIYTSWDACKSMVHGFPGAVYKGFATRAEAEQFLEEKKEEQKEPENSTVRLTVLLPSMDMADFS